MLDVARMRFSGPARGGAGLSARRTNRRDFLWNRGGCSTAPCPHQASVAPELSARRRRARATSRPHAAERRMRPEPLEHRGDPSPVAADIGSSSTPIASNSRRVSATSSGSGGVRLVHHDHLGLVRERRRIPCQLRVDDAVILERRPPGPVVKVPSTIWRSTRHRSTWRRNWWPRPCPSVAPSMRPGMSATTKRARPRAAPRRGSARAW